MILVFVQESRFRITFCFAQWGRPTKIVLYDSVFS